MQETCGMITITDRKKVTLTGISSVESFDEYEVVLSVSCGTLTVEGENLSITGLDLEKGTVEATGLIRCVAYSDAGSGKKGLAARLFGRNE